MLELLHGAATCAWEGCSGTERGTVKTGEGDSGRGLTLQRTEHGLAEHVGAESLCPCCGGRGVAGSSVSSRSG